MRASQPCCGRSEPSLKGKSFFCDRGDTLHGSIGAVQTQDPALVPILNAPKFDAITACWDSEYGPGVLR